MKGRFLLPLVILAATSISGAWANSEAFKKKALETKDLLGYWAFDGNFDDGTTNKNAAKAAGANPALVTFCPGVNGGQGVQIDNVNHTDAGSFVEVPTPIGSIFDTPTFSAVFWAKNTKIAPATDDDQWNSLLDRNSLWYMEHNSVEDENGQLVARLVVRLYSADNPTGGGTPQIGRGVLPDEPVHVKQDEWHMYTMTYDGAKIATYVDDKLVQEYEYDQPVGPTADTPAEAPRNNYNLTWGGWQQRGDFFTGCFDDTAYYGRALTAEEVKALHDAMKAAAPQQ